METKAVAISWLAVFWICCYSAQALPVESEKGKNEFVFLLPTGEGGSNLYSGISVNLEPPVVDSFRNARDSYGNPVSPYGATNLNAEDGTKVLNAAGLQFEIPSYASGITEIRKPTNELLPPLVSGEVPQDALQIPVVAQPPVELLPPLSIESFSNVPKDIAINEVTGRIDLESTSTPETTNKQKEQDEQKPEDHTDPQKYDGERYTGGFGGSPGFLGEQREKGYAIKEKEEKEAKEAESSPSEEPQTDKEIKAEEPSLKEAGKDQNTETQPQPTPSSSLPSENNQPESVQTPYVSDVQFSTAFNSVFSPVITQTDTPSFGPEPIKTSLKSSSVTPPALVPTIPTSSDNIPPQQIPIITTSSEFSPPLAGRFDSDKDVQPILPSQLSFPTLPKIPSNLDSKSQLPQSNLGIGLGLSGPEPSKTNLSPSSVTPPAPVPAIPTSSDNIPPQQIPIITPSSEYSPPLAGRFDSDKDVQPILPSQPSFPTLPKISSNLDPKSQLPQSNLGTGFGFSGPLFPVQPISSGANKYSGGFGGAPGVLGNQGKPGYAVQSDGSIKDPDHTYRPPRQTVAPIPAPLPTHQSPVVAPVKYDKYTGGFGGPPGILLPNDKH